MNEELEFDRLLADKRHKEMVKCLTELNKDGSDALKQIASKLENKDDSEMKKIGETIITKLDEMINREIELDIIRDRNGDMKTIKIKTINI